MPVRTSPPSSSSGNPPAFNVPPVTLWCCLFLLGVFLGLRFGPPHWADWMFEHLAFSTRKFGEALAEGPPGPRALFPLVGHSLLHLDWLHFTVNAGLLLAFGSVIERRFGRFAFLSIYLLAAMAGALSQYLVTLGRDAVMIGASGAVYGMMGAAVPLLFARRPRRAVAFIAVIMLVNLAIGLLSGFYDLFGAAIAWQAHVGGFLAGLLPALWQARRRGLNVDRR